MNDKLREALVVASHAIEQAVLCEDGLDGAEAERVLHRIDAVLADSATKPGMGVAEIIDAQNRLSAVAPPSTNPDTSVDGEPTDEMVEDGMQAMGYKAEDRPYGGARQRFIKGLRAALAVRPKGEG